jgi:hypothetical protein
MSLEIITRYEKGKPTTYSMDKGKTWLTKAEYKKLIHKAKKGQE